jgi:integrase
MPRKRPNGAGSVFYRKPTTGKKAAWVAQVKVRDPLTGRTRTVSRTAGTRDEARRLLAELLAGAPATHPGGAETVAGWFQRWSDTNLPRLPLAPRTRTIYRDLLAWYGIPAAGTVELRGFTPTLAEAWLDRVAAAPKRDGGRLAPSTVRGVYVAAVKALDTAVRDGLIPTNPLRAVERPKVPRAHVPVTGAADVDKLLEACEGRRVEPLVWFVAYTGVRIGEALGLQWADVDLDAGTAVIRRSAPGAATTKTGRTRTVTLVPAVAAQLGTLRGNGGYVFASASGGPLDRRNATRELQAALAAAGVPTARPWHSLRHGLAHRLLAGGVPLHVVSSLLGHSGIGITADLYGHVDSRVPADVLTGALR